MRIVFFGTPEFAVPSLEALLAERAQVVGVVTQPDKPHGRSRSTLVPPPVKQAALQHGLPLLQPERPRGDVFLAALRHWQPEIGVVAAYGHILRPEVLSLPSRGMINVHASLLPRLRGAAPINWAIHEGDAETGISIMVMEAGMDTGPVLHRNAIPIAPDETAGTLTERLAALGADTLVESLALMRLGGIAPEPQDEARATYAPKIDRRVTRIDWTAKAEVVSRSIRAFDPLPGAWSDLHGHEIKLFGARPVAGAGNPGEVLAVAPAFVVAAGSGAVQVDEVKPSGKARMPAADWIRGRGAETGRVFQ
ncbi:MAG TPA: methionyl-tRNA formyltransferase [Gemmatimonadales bacterium]|nr:methionyl-tRNA formyltransferase [Gemmatimonadales bacterium]